MTPGPDVATVVTDSIATQLAHRITGEVTIVPTNNSVRLVSYRKRKARIEVRISRRLMSLGDQVVEPIVGFVCDAPHARAALRDLYGQLPSSPSRRRGRPTMQSMGEFHDLDAILKLESENHFGEPADVDITWGARRRVASQRSIRLGSYHFEQHFIRIHPRLDHSLVPGWFVGFVVFHELLHHRLGVTMKGGRRVLHSKAFRSLEAKHPRYQDAREWELRSLPKLLRGRGRWRSRS